MIWFVKRVKSSWDCWFVMDYIAPTVRDLEVDLESGCTVSGDDLSEETFLGVKKQAKTMLAKICSRFIDGSINNENKISLCGNVSNNDGLSGENAIVQESKDIEGKKVAKEKRKKSSNKKAPKPPKPPRGPSLDSADLKLIKEISELAMLKRARIERMKALKKMKASKQSSSNSNMFATVFTVLFCLVILFQGNIFFTNLHLIHLELRIICCFSDRSHCK